MTVEDHITILNASERLDEIVPRLKEAVFSADMLAQDMASIVIWLAAVEGITDYLREKAKVIAETQP